MAIVCIISKDRVLMHITIHQYHRGMMCYNTSNTPVNHFKKIGQTMVLHFFTHITPTKYADFPNHLKLTALARHA